MTRWSKLDTAWEGAPITHLAGGPASSRRRPRDLPLEYGYTANVPLEIALQPDALVAWNYDGKPLDPEHGYPLRALVPGRYFWKSAKWLRGIEFSVEDRPGFWERNGYSNNADPWREGATPMTEPYPPPAPHQPRDPPPARSPHRRGPAASLAPPPPATVRRLSPLWQTAVVCFVGLTVSGALVVLSLFSRNLFVPLVLAATAIAVAVGHLRRGPGWRGSQRAARRGAQGRAATIALVSGAMLIVAAVAISGAIWIVLLFFL